MGLFVALVIFIIGIVRHRRNGCWYSPDAMFCYMWAVITFLSSLHLYTMYESSDFVYLIVLIGTISFVLGVNYSMKLVITPARPRGADTQDFISKKALWFFILLLFILRFKPFVQSIALQMAGTDLQELRHEFFDANQSMADILISTVVSLLRPLVEVEGIVYFIRDMKKNYFMFFAIILLTLIESAINGGRFGMAFLIVELVVAYMLFRNRPELSFSNVKKYAKRIAFYILILGGAIIGVTLLRGTEKDELFVKYYRYLCGNIIFFDLHIPLIKSLPWYPLCTGFYGFWCLFLPLLHVFGIPYPGWYLDVTNNVMNTQEFFQIGTDLYTNAFSTPFYYLYADMRLPGVIFGMLLFGIFAGISFRKATINSDNKHFVLYILVCQMIFMTIFCYPFTNAGYVLIALYFLYLRMVKRTKRT